MAGYSDHVSRRGLMACVVLTLLATGMLVPGESQFVEVSDPAVPPAAVVSVPVIVAATPTQSTLPPASSGLAATVTTPTPVERGPQVQVGPTPAPPVRPVPMPGDCLSWSGEFVARGATADEIRFFFGEGIVERESGCGRDTLNDATGDTGICQINNVQNRSGWFGGRYFGGGGWLLALHGLRTRQVTDSPAWVDPCLTLYRVCGERPWRLGVWGCDNNPLEAARS